MFTSLNEAQFLLNEIQKNHKVLEYGSGQSTKELADKCDRLLSIEHQQDWYNKVLETKPKNCELLCVPPSLPYREGGHCGTHDEFKDYIEAPLPYAPFDIIFIDGRARVGCASICHKLGHNNTIVFIHDYTRSEYKDVEKYLQFVDSCGVMAKYNIL